MEAETAVHRLCFIPSSSDIATAIENTLYSIGASSTSSWSGQISVYPHTASTPSNAAGMGRTGIASSSLSSNIADVHVVALNNDPQELHLVVRPAKQVISAAQDIQPLLQRIGFVKFRSALQLQGVTYSVPSENQQLDRGVIFVTVGRAVHLPSNEYKGLFIDIHSNAVGGSGGDGQQEAEAIIALLSEAVAASGASLQQLQPAYDGYKLSTSRYTKQHLVIAYVQLMQHAVAGAGEK